jgi:hypothetical protein
MNKLRFWLIQKLVGKMPIAMNLYLTRGLYIDMKKTKGGHFINVNVDCKDDPDGVGINFR